MDVQSKSFQDLFEGLPRLIGLLSCGPERPEYRGAPLAEVCVAEELPPYLPHGGRSIRVRDPVRSFRAGCSRRLHERRYGQGGEAVLALLQLGLHEGNRAWKGFDWEAMQRLHAKGCIYDPVGKAKSVVFTDAGLRESERLLRERLGR